MCRRRRQYTVWQEPAVRNYRLGWCVMTDKVQMEEEEDWQVDIRYGHCYYGSEEMRVHHHHHHSYISQEENYYLYPLQWQSACHVTSTILVIVYHHLLLVQWLCSLSDCGSILFIFSIQTWRRCRSVRRVFCLPTWVTGGRKSIYQLSGFGGRGRGE